MHMAQQQQQQLQPVQSKMLIDSRSRDIRRRIDVIQKKIADLQDFGVPCAFTYTSARNTGSIFTIGDSRVTDVIEHHKNEILKNLMDNEAVEGSYSTNEIHMILPPLPAPLEELNRTSLQTLITGILKDLGLKWTDPQPNWWPPDVPFVPPRSTPENFSGSWTQALQRVLESVYSYFSYDANTYVASRLETWSRSPPATKAAATVNESSDEGSLEASSSGSIYRHSHHGSSSSSDDSTIAVAMPSSGAVKMATNCSLPSPEDSRLDKSTSSTSAAQRKLPSKSISSFTVENILMGRQRSSSSSDSPTTTSGSFSTTPPLSSSSSVSTASGTNHSSVVGTNWVSHPPVKYTKFTMLSPTSMADETQKKKKTDSMIEVQWRDSETGQASLSSSIDHGRELKRIPSSLRGSMDLPSSFPITQKPKSFCRSASSGTPSSFFHKINIPQSDPRPSRSFQTQTVLQTATKMSALPVVQTVPAAPDVKAAVLHQNFPPAGQQVVLLIPSDSTSITGNLPTIFYTNPSVLSLSQSTTTASPAGVTKLATLIPPSVSTTASAARSSTSTSQGNEAGKAVSSPPSSVYKRHTVIDEAAKLTRNQSTAAESPHRPIATKASTTTPTSIASAINEPELQRDSKNSDKMKLYLKRTMPKPPKLRFHMTTVMRQSTGNTVMTSLTAQSPQAITCEATGAEHGPLSAAVSENERHSGSEVGVESTITKSPNVYSNNGNPPLHKSKRAMTTRPWTTATTTRKQEQPDSDDSSPTVCSPQNNHTSNSDTTTNSKSSNSTATIKNGTVTPQTTVLKDSGFHLQLVKQPQTHDSSNASVDMNTNGPQPQLQNSTKEHESGSDHSTVQKCGRQNGRQSGPGRGRGRATRSYTRRKRELTFHLYEDPSTAFRAKRLCRDKEQ